MTVAGIPIAFFTEWPEVIIYALCLIVGLRTFIVIWRYDGILTVPSFFLALLFFSNIVTLPFTASPINIVTATGVLGYLRYLPAIPFAFYITAFGFVILCSVFLYAYRPENPPGTPAPFMDIITKSLREFWLTDEALTALSGILLLITAILVIMGIPLFHGREAGQFNPAIRPLITIQSLLASFALILAFTAAFVCRSVANICTIGIAIPATLIAGTRSAPLTPIVLLLILMSSWTRSRNIFKIGTVICGLLAAAIAISSLRQHGSSHFGLGVTVASSLFYGNNFSDLRDFSWILSGWNHGLLLGKTYLSGMLGFVPSYLFPLRNEWAWGPMSLRFAHISDPLGLHPGLRGSFIAEPYLNFGFVGLIVIAAIYARALAANAAFIGSARRQNNRREFAVQTASNFIYVQLSTSLLYSAGFFSVYVTSLLIATGILVAGLPYRLPMSNRL